MILLYVGVATLLFFLAMGRSESPQAVAQMVNQADVVVQFDNQAHLLRTIEFTQPISGLTALQRSGLAVVITETSFGPAVCSIEKVGCPAENCFCDANRFWSYTYWDGSAWQSYAVGAGSSVISQTNAIEGWRWGEFGASQIAPTQPLAAGQGLTWLQSRQSITNGGYSGIGAAVETLLAIGANHIAANEWRRGATAPSLADYVIGNSAAYARNSAAGAGKLAVALAAADLCLPAGTLTPQGHYSPTLGAYSKQSGPQSWAILGAVAISETVPAPASSFLKQAQQTNGGWEWAPGWGADTNATALAIQALVATGEPISASTVISGLAFVQAAQKDDGGFAYDLTVAATSDGNSTAYVVQALLAAGEDPVGTRWTISNSNPISYLLNLQLPDGSLQWQPQTGTNQLATQQAIPALLGRSYPVQRRLIQACPTIYLPVIVNR